MNQEVVDSNFNRDGTAHRNQRLVIDMFNQN